MTKKLTSVQPFGEDGELRMVVEVPRGSTVKLTYEPKLGFVVSRCLPLGLAYPFDWGFIPGTGAVMAIRWMLSLSMTARPIRASSFPANRSA
jgi:hypothetical protein